MENPYLDLTAEFNRGRLRVLLSSGQAVVVHRERRQLIRANEERLARYQAAAEGWAEIWPSVQRQVEGAPLLDAHRLILSRAAGVLPFEPAGGTS